jgi:hypothetical protein
MRCYGLQLRWRYVGIVPGRIEFPEGDAHLPDQKKPDIGAKIAVVDKGASLRGISMLLYSGVVETANAGCRKPIEQRIVIRIKRSPQVIHGDGQPGTQSRNIVAVQVDMKVAGVNELEHIGHGHRPHFSLRSGRSAPANAIAVLNNWHLYAIFCSNLYSDAFTHDCRH